MTEMNIKNCFDLGLKIHRKFGAGLFENVYEECLFYELKKNWTKGRKKQKIPIIYEELKLKMPMN